MSDSEDSDSFLSADEAGGDAGNESSDITLSSDSEPDEGGKAAPGDPDSSDITLSSDDGDRYGDHAKQCSVKLDAKESRDTESEAKGANQAEDVAQTESGPIKTSGEADIDEHVGQQNSSPKPENDTPKSSVSLPDPSSVLPPSSLDIEGRCIEPKAPAKAGPPNAPSLLEPTESALHTETAIPLTCRNTSVSPVKEAPASQVPQAQSASNATTPTKAADDAGGASELQTSASAESNVSCALEGWGDQDEDLTALPGVAADAAQGEASDWGWKSGSTSPAESAPTASESKAPPPSCPGATAPSISDTPSAPGSSPPPPEPAPGRRRPERRERRGPLKLGAKKLGAKLAAPPTQQSEESEAAGAAGSGGSQPSKDGGAATSASRCAPAPAVPSQQEQTQDAWGSWETWSSSLLSSAAGVTKTVLETVETGFGVPEPEDLARITREEEEHYTTTITLPASSDRHSAPAPAPAVADPGLGLGSWFGGVSQLLGQTSSLVVSTGLDTLEAIGKKTMNVLQDDQLGIHDTISQLSGQKPSLSQALREAREKRGDSVPCSPAAAVGDRAPSQPPTFSHMFDQCDGTVHLEALEMLSARCRSRVTAAKGRVDEAAGIVLDTIEELCTPDELAEVEVTDFETQLSSLLSRLSVPIKPSRLIIAQSSAGQWLAAAESAVPRHVLGRAVRAAAEIGAGLAEFLHKLSELRLVEAGGGGGDPVSAARHLAALAALVAAQAGLLAARFAETLSGQTEERAAAATTDIYLEVSYLQKFCGDSLSLMAPILQMAALNGRS